MKRSDVVIGHVYQMSGLSTSNRKAPPFSRFHQHNVELLNERFPTWEALNGIYVRVVSHKEGDIFRVVELQQNIPFNLNYCFMSPVSGLVALACVDLHSESE